MVVASSRSTDVDRPSGAASGRLTASVTGRTAVWLVPGILALVVGWWGKLRVGITRDETSTIDVSTRSVPQIWHTVQHADAVHALYYVLMHFWTEAFGVTTLAIRIPSIIGTAVAAALLAVLGRMLVSPRAGLTAGVLYAAAPEASFYAHDARSYGLDSALIVGLVIVFVIALRSPGRWPWLGYAALLLVTVVMHLFTLLIVPALAITVALVARTGRDWTPVRRWLVSTAIVGLLLVPFIRRAVAQGGTAAWIPTPRWLDVGTFIEDMSGGGYLIAPMLVLAALAILVKRRSANLPSVAEIGLPWLVVPPLLMFLGSLWQPFYVFRYLLYCLPALMLLVAAGLDRFRWWVHTLLVVALLALTIPLHIGVRDTNFGADDLRAQAQYLAANKRPGDAIVFLDPAQREFAMSDRKAYAGLRDIALAKPPAEAANFSGTDVSRTVLQDRLRTVDRVWAVKYWLLASKRAAARPYEDQRYAMFKAAGLHWVSTKHFRGGVIQLYQRN